MLTPYKTHNSENSLFLVVATLEEIHKVMLLSAVFIKSTRMFGSFSYQRTQDLVINKLLLYPLIFSTPLQQMLVVMVGNTNNLDIR